MDAQQTKMIMESKGCCLRKRWEIGREPMVSITDDKDGGLPVVRNLSINPVSLSCEDTPSEAWTEIDSN